jgi:hypothetical protein
MTLHFLLYQTSAVLPSVILRSVIRLHVFMLSVIWKSVIRLNVAALSSGNWSKPFFFVIMQQNKLECFFLAHVIQARLTYEIRALNVP